jgi:crotonobetainyl-CoA:carnitine CoA-transferase CaiB-like acyl-CoA transferase
LIAPECQHAGVAQKPLTGSLEGIRVLELGQLIAGPFCGQMFADHGAEVVKIEPPGTGDVMRQWGRSDAQGNALWWPVIARNKKSLTVDLHRPEGQKLVRELASKADVLIENFKVGRMEEWGLGYEELSASNPGLIMVRISGFGQTGPYSKRGGFAAVGEAMAGLRYISGYPDRPPVRVGLSLGDTLTGHLGFEGALLALLRRGQTGKGQVVDCSIFESVLSVMESVITEYDRGGHVRERAGSVLPGIAPSNAYPTRDGVPIIIGANQDGLFRRLTKIMGVAELADDDRFRTHQARGRNQLELDEIISTWTAGKSVSWLEDQLSAAGVPAGRTYRASDMLADPHFAARGSIVRVDDERLGSTAMQSVFPKLSESPGAVRHLGPDLGEHVEPVLSGWLDYDSGAIARLRDAGVV